MAHIAYINYTVVNATIYDTYDVTAFSERVGVATIVRVCDTQTTQGLLPAVDANQSYYITVQGTGFGSEDLSWSDPRYCRPLALPCFHPPCAHFPPVYSPQPCAPTRVATRLSRYGVRITAGSGIATCDTGILTPVQRLSSEACLTHKSLHAVADAECTARGRVFCFDCVFELCHVNVLLPHALLTAIGRGGAVQPR